MADLTTQPVIEASEVRRQVFEATGYSLTDAQLDAVVSAMAAGAPFDAFMALMADGFSDPAKAEQTRQALDGFARRPAEPIQ